MLFMGVVVMDQDLVMVMIFIYVQMLILINVAGILNNLTIFHLVIISQEQVVTIG
jgi:hypothetical protein